MKSAATATTATTTAAPRSASAGALARLRTGPRASPSAAATSPNAAQRNAGRNEWAISSLSVAFSRSPTAVAAPLPLSCFGEGLVDVGQADLGGVGYIGELEEQRHLLLERERSAEHDLAADRLRVVLELVERRDEHRRHGGEREHKANVAGDDRPRRVMRERRAVQGEQAERL